MRKKKEEVDEKLKEVLTTVSDKLRADRLRTLNVAELHVLRTEKNLTDTFTEEQKELFKDYLDAKREYDNVIMRIDRGEL